MNMNNQKNFYNDFRKFAMDRTHASGLLIDDYARKLSPVAYQNPYVLEQSNMNMTQMDIFSRLMVDRIIFLGQEINDDLANIIVGQMLWLSHDDPEKAVNIYINSPGGSIAAGWAIQDAFEMVDLPYISTIAVGTAASMASILLVSGTIGHRYATKRSRILLHQPLGGFGQREQASDMEIAVKEINYAKRKLYECLSERTGTPYEKVERDADRDFWLSAEEAKNYGTLGIIDSILEPKKREETK
jgi:ATP-dependent Clp protease protease subunit